MNYVTKERVIRLWTYLFSNVRNRSPKTDVVFHDPSAQKAQNLDDPFLDPEAQRRIGKLIGDASMQRKLPRRGDEH